MLMSFSELAERTRRARCALDDATSDNIIELCRRYHALLAERRMELYKLPERLGINQWSGPFLWEDVKDVRKSVRAAIESATRERNRTEALLHSFTAVRGYEAVETFNRQKFKGHDDWVLRAGWVVRFSDHVAGERMAMQEAVAAASLLRRMEHIARSAATAGVSSGTRHDISPAARRTASEGNTH